MLKKLQLFLFSALLAVPVFTATQAFASNTPSAVVFVYHRIGQDDFSNSNLTVDTFSQHIRLLKEEKFHVLPLDDILTALDNGTHLPDNTIALTFEGAFASTRDHAIPLLLENEIPFTIFFSSSRVDRDAQNYMSWEDLRTLKSSHLVDFGLLPASYTHLVNENDEDIRASINQGLSRMQEELNIRPKVFAYPYGEYSKALENIVDKYDFLGAFGQHSGSLHAKSDRLRLPRFSMTEHYGGLDRFKMTARSKPMVITDLMPEDHFISDNDQDDNIRLGFSVKDAADQSIDQLSCFASEIGKLDLTRIADNHFEADISDIIHDGRTRINCTMPSINPVPGEDRRWHWFGMMLTKGIATEEF